MHIVPGEGPGQQHRGVPEEEATMRWRQRRLPDGGPEDAGARDVVTVGRRPGQSRQHDLPIHLPEAAERQGTLPVSERRG